MKVLRIVPNLACDDPEALAAFYRNLFGLDVAMSMGFIVTMNEPGRRQQPQVSFASEGGGGTPVPAISIEVDDIERVIARARLKSIPIEYGPVDEPWNVRRIFIRDPAGHLINVLSHVT
ncbi:glyoxalase [Pseudooceanicola sp. 216_PA32_1]|uniref:Glyoxalase n=1 Tax=Pseudooceanicola pacificus TaxID=2676438 RepID=A0A844WDI1_9RHOB|nr:VOC family protein [Pseudooceanicola pacificus]MWB79238.1 glyoxalase [Pseudooceanicola pacificus]